jgi:NADPH:quinone reductase-like Zn-dependent oxidoreductase
MEWTEVPDPSPGPGQVLIRVLACGVNHFELRNRSPEGEGRVALPRIPGADVAGEIVEAAPDVRLEEWGLHPGRLVVVHPGLGCGRCPACRRGEDNRCPDYRIFGWHLDGGAAELLACPVENVLPAPAGLFPEEAAAFPLTFLTAWHMLARKARLEGGERVLVTGATGGVGTAALQIASALGARVLAATTRPEREEELRALGAEEVVSPLDPAFEERVRKWSGGEGCDVVVDHVGGKIFPLLPGVLRRGGRIVTCGSTGGWEAQLNLRELYRRQISILGSFMGTRGDMLAVLSLVEARRVRPVISRVFPAQEIALAHRHVEGREHLGKAVLRLA